MLNGLDHNDEAILGLLKEDGRMSLRQIADQLDLNEATIRNRIRKMENSGRIKVVARVDLKSAGYQFVAIVGLGVRGRSIEEICEELTELPQVISILAVIGRNDLELQVIAQSMSELDELLYQRIAGIDGVSSIESALASNVVKYEQPWGQFE